MVKEYNSCSSMMTQICLCERTDSCLQKGTSPVAHEGIMDVQCNINITLHIEGRFQMTKR